MDQDVSPVDILPDEMLLMIFKYLSVRDLELSASTVCRRWKCLISHIVARVQSADDYPKIHGRLTALYVTKYIPSLHTYILALHISSMKNLKELTICVDHRLEVEDLKLIETLQNLCHLDVFTKQHLDKDTPLPCNITSLVVNSDMVPGFLSALKRNNRGFKAFHMYGKAKIFPSKQIDMFLQENSSCLTELTLRCSYFENENRIVVGGPAANSGGVYSEDDIIMVDKDALAAAAAADDEDLEKARNACGVSVYQCTICPESFQLVNDYREHVATHPAGARHSCWTCGAQFTNKDSLKDHAILHAVQTAEQCNLCNTSFQSNAELRRHESACSATCPVCDMRCGTRATLAAHARRSHARAPPLLCAACFETLPTAEAFAAHALTHRQAERFVCGYDACILRFATRNDLLAHIRKCHAGEAGDAPDPAPPADRTTPPAVACEQCGRTFGSVAAMKRHARVHRREALQQEPEDEWDGGAGEIEQALSRMHGLQALDGDVEYLEMEALEDL